MITKKCSGCDREFGVMVMPSGYMAHHREIKHCPFCNSTEVKDCRRELVEEAVRRGFREAAPESSDLQKPKGSK